MYAPTINRQPLALLSQESWSLPVWAVHTAGRVIQISLKKMKAIITSWEDWQPQVSHYQFSTLVAFFDNTDVQHTKNFDISLTGVTSASSLKSAFSTAILTYANNVKSYGMVASDIVWGIPTAGAAGLENAPQAAIADAPADAVTNYNTVTTLLGTLTGAMNTANTKQNEIATKLNTLLSELRTLGLISS